jgi:N-sulfoglucosamine sulfohydrolase
VLIRSFLLIQSYPGFVLKTVVLQTQPEQYRTMNSNRRSFLVALFCVMWLLPLFGTVQASTSKPNILLITVDDMSCDSVGVFGCKLPNTTPTMDRLASESLRFQHAHVQTGSCMPSRNVMLSGRYSHNNRVEGFYQVPNPGYPVAADLMRAGGYFTAIRHKVSHSTPYSPYKWDLVLDNGGAKADHKNIASYGVCTREGIAAAKNAGKPFFLNVNISDPHKPFYAEGKGGVTVPDTNVPSRVFTPEEVPVPGFLPDDPAVRKELSHYYSSVRRADDCLAQILKALRDSGAETNTVVIFLSDHGMPLPFAKTQVYFHSTHTPLMVRWPGVTKPNTVDNRHMVSAVDLLPTLLDITATDHPKGLDGRSFLSLLRGQEQTDRDRVFTHHNENSGGHRNPMRAVQTKDHLYIFNPWSNGTRIMGTATAGTPTWHRMKAMAQNDLQMAARVDLMEHRVLEEFYQVSRDPDCLKNLIADSASQKEINRLRAAMEEWMRKTSDPLLAVFQKRDDPAVREAFVKAAEKGSSERPARKGKRKAGRKNAED